MYTTKRQTNTKFLKKKKELYEIGMKMLRKGKIKIYLFIKLKENTRIYNNELIYIIKKDKNIKIFSKIVKE
jgi:hypothetical protein